MLCGPEVHNKYACAASGGESTWSAAYVVQPAGSVCRSDGAQNDLEKSRSCLLNNGKDLGARRQPKTVADSFFFKEKEKKLY
jgi:hypothetical protein